jgi:hypothetical protein
MKSAALSVPAVGPVDVSQLEARLNLAALIARGWNPESRVFAPPADDPLFGYHSCERAGCPRAGQSDRARALGLCDACAHNYLQRRDGNRGVAMSLGQFKAFPARRVAQSDREERLCLVCCTPGHERASRQHGLCPNCDRHRRERRQTIGRTASFVRPLCRGSVSTLGGHRRTVLRALPQAVAAVPRRDAPDAGGVHRSGSVATVL